MQRRNWLDLSRKLVDRFDLSVTCDDIAAAIGLNVLAERRFGIIPSRSYPSPFVTTLSGSDMGGLVTAGMAYDPTGQRIEVTSTQPFTLQSDGTNPRKALLVARYAQVGDTTIPKPSDPSSNVFLNLLDSFQIVVLLGTPAGSPVYPATGAGDVVLMGYSIPAAAVTASAATEDRTVRDQGLSDSKLIAAAYNATPFDKFLLCNATGGSFVVTLPPSRFAEGMRLDTQKIDSSVNTVTVQASGADTIRMDGSTPSSFIITEQAESVSWQLVGGVWYIL